MNGTDWDSFDSRRMKRREYTMEKRNQNKR
jgi:hypothetical protein